MRATLGQYRQWDYPVKRKFSLKASRQTYPIIPMVTAGTTYSKIKKGARHALFKTIHFVIVRTICH